MERLRRWEFDRGANISLFFSPKAQFDSFSTHNSPLSFIPPFPSLLHPHQSVLLLAEDHLMMEVHVSKVLCYGEAAQTVTRVVEVSGPGHRNTSMVHMATLCGSVAQMAWYWLARLIQKAPGWILTAQEDVLLQGLLLKHPPLQTQLRLSCTNKISLNRRVTTSLWKQRRTCMVRYKIKNTTKNPTKWAI